MAHPHTHRVSELIGRRVCNRAGDDIGRLEELMLDLERGFIAYALVRVEAPAAKWFAIPWGALRADPDDGSLRLEVSPEVFRRAPGMAPAEAEEHHLATAQPPA